MKTRESLLQDIRLELETMNAEQLRRFKSLLVRLQNGEEAEKLIKEAKGYARP